MIKSSIFSVLLFGLAGFVNADSVEQGVFSGAVKVGNKEPVIFSLTVPVGEIVRIELDQFELEISTTSPEQASLKLLDHNNEVLHAKEIQGDISATPSFLYHICGGSVVHITPKPSLADVEKCNE